MFQLIAVAHIDGVSRIVSVQVHRYAAWLSLSAEVVLRVIYSRAFKTCRHFKDLRFSVGAVNFAGPRITFAPLYICICLLDSLFVPCIQKRHWPPIIALRLSMILKLLFSLLSFFPADCGATRRWYLAWLLVYSEVPLFWHDTISHVLDTLQLVRT